MTYSLLISDLHLDPARPEHLAALETLLDNHAGKADRLRLREVQEAMRDASLERLAAATAGEWADDSLMDRVAQNPRLAAGMRNPKFAAALLALQKDPRVAMARFANHPEIGDFLREFCGVMGQHFTELGEAQQKQKQKQKQKQQLSLIHI